jgi:hypothetical protein
MRADNKDKVAGKVVITVNYTTYNCPAAGSANIAAVVQKLF